MCTLSELLLLSTKEAKRSCLSGEIILWKLFRLTLQNKGCAEILIVKTLRDLSRSVVWLNICRILH